MAAKSGGSSTSLRVNSQSLKNLVSVSMFSKTGFSIYHISLIIISCSNFCTSGCWLIMLQMSINVDECILVLTFCRMQNNCKRTDGLLWLLFLLVIYISLLSRTPKRWEDCSVRCIFFPVKEMIPRQGKSNFIGKRERKYLFSVIVQIRCWRINMGRPWLHFC